MENKTHEEAIQYIQDFLKENKVKEIEMEGEDTILFRNKGITYSVFVEDSETVHYGVYSMDDVDLGRDFWEYKDEVENYKHIEDWFEDIVKNNAYANIKKIWRTFEKLSEEGDEDLNQIAAVYFGMF